MTTQMWVPSNVIPRGFGPTENVWEIVGGTTVVVGAAVVVEVGAAVAGATVVVGATVVAGATVVVVGATVVAGATVVVAVTVVVGAAVVVEVGAAVSELPPHPEATNKNVTATAYFLMVSVCHPSSEAERSNPLPWGRDCYLPLRGAGVSLTP